MTRIINRLAQKLTRQRRRVPAIVARAVVGTWIAVILPVTAAGQTAAHDTDYSKGPAWFPNVLSPYRVQPLPPVPLTDPVDLAPMIVDGKLQLSLEQLRSFVLRNNLEIASTAQNTAMAETDILRARGGGAPRGAPGVRVPSGLFAGAIGAGVGDTTSIGGTTGAGGITGNARQVVLRPRGTFDPSIALNCSYDRTQTPLNTLVVAGVPTVLTATTALQARFAQAFTSGTSLSVGFNNQKQSSSQQFLRFNPAFVSSFSLIITQQLLNGAGFDVNRRFLTIAERGKKITTEAVRQQVMTTLSQAETLYWDLVAARDNVTVAEKSVQVAEQLYEDNREREAAGALSKIEVFTAASEVSARRRDLIAAQTVFELRETDLKTTLTRDVARIIASVRVEPTDSLPDPRSQPLPRLEDMLATALESRPELRQGEANLQNQDVAIRYTANLLKPTLVLFGMVNSAGLYGDHLVDSPAGPVIVNGGLRSALGQVSRFNFPEYAFGFSLQFPMMNRSAQADHARARIEKQQAETSLQQLRNRIRLEVRTAMIALTQSSAQVQSALKVVELSERSLEEEEEKLLAGLSTPYDLIRRQRDLMAARLEEVRARTDYAKARVDLDRAIGRTGEK